MRAPGDSGRPHFCYTVREASAETEPVISGATPPFKRAEARSRRERARSRATRRRLVERGRVLPRRSGRRDFAL